MIELRVSINIKVKSEAEFLRKIKTLCNDQSVGQWDFDFKRAKSEIHS